jgi:hypothetical protein
MADAYPLSQHVHGPCQYTDCDIWSGKWSLYVIR